MKETGAGRPLRRRLKEDEIMIFDRSENKPVIALLGAGSMGTAIVRRIAAGRRQYKLAR